MTNSLIQVNNTSLTTGISAGMFEDFFNFIDATEKSIATYKRALRQFWKYLYSKGITAPTREDIIAFREDLKLNHKPTTVQAYIVAVRLFFKWTAQKDLYKNIADNIKGAKISKAHKKDYLTSNQIKEVITSIDTSTIQGLRDKAIVSLMVTGGLRTIEVSRADIEDLRTLGNSTVLYIQGKGRQEKTDYVKLPTAVEKAIREYLKAVGLRDAKSPLFVSTSNNSINKRLSTRTISGIVKDSLIKAGYNSDRLTAHSLRHSAATLNLLNGATLEETQQLLRHTNINTTMIYLHHLERENNHSEERIANAIGL